MYIFYSTVSVWPAVDGLSTGSGKRVQPTIREIHLSPGVTLLRKQTELRRHSYLQLLRQQLKQ